MIPDPAARYRLRASALDLLRAHADEYARLKLARHHLVKSARDHGVPLADIAVALSITVSGVRYILDNPGEAA